MNSKQWHNTQDARNKNSEDYNTCQEKPMGGKDRSKPPHFPPKSPNRVYNFWTHGKKGSFRYIYAFGHATMISNLSCRSMAKLWRKFPPKTRESIGVMTAWIQPVGRNTVWPWRMTHLISKTHYHGLAISTNGGATWGRPFYGRQNVLVCFRFTFQQLKVICTSMK